MKFLLYYVVCISFCAAFAESPMEEIKRLTHILKPGIEEHIDDGYEFQMFCRIGDRKYIGYYFRTITLRITSAAEDIKLIRGHNPKDVYLQYRQQGKWLLWIANVLPWRVRDTSFPTFNTSCVGISTTRPYTARVIIRPVDPWKVFTLAAGIALYFLAPKLCESALFFYTSGTFFGSLAFALMFLFIAWRFLPKSRSGYFFLSLLWTVTFYYVGETWKKLEEMVHDRMHYIIAYLFSGAIISFLACYRWGPPKNSRTIDIIRWALQVSGLVLVHFSSDFVEMSTAIIIFVVMYDKINPHFMSVFSLLYRRWFPSKRRLLTEEEYITQGAVETQRALEELRSFCSSPESKPWKLVSRLKNPRRFSGFMEGASHLNDDEMLAYDSEDSLIYQPRAALPSTSPPVNVEFCRRSSSANRSSTANRSTATTRLSTAATELVTDDEDTQPLDMSIETDDED